MTGAQGLPLALVQFKSAEYPLSLENCFHLAQTPSFVLELKSTSLQNSCLFFGSVLVMVVEEEEVGALAGSHFCCLLSSAVTATS